MLGNDLWIRVDTTSHPSDIPADCIRQIVISAGSFGGSFGVSAGGSTVAQIVTELNLTAYVRHMIASELGEGVVIQVSPGEVAEVRAV